MADDSLRDEILKIAEEIEGEAGGQERQKSGYAEIVASVRARLDDLAAAAIEYERSVGQHSAMLASTWATRRESIHNHDEAEAWMVSDAQSLKEALYRFANEVELGLNEPLVFAWLMNQQERAHAHVIFDILSVRATCSELCKRIVPQWGLSAGDASFAATPVPPASEIDKIIAHGTKLVTLLNQGQKIE